MESSRKGSEQLEENFRQVFSREKQGRFAEAEGIIAGIDAEKLDGQERAEFQLRKGAIAGFRQRHEESKSLLKAALDFYQPKKHPYKAAECLNYLALAYWRNPDEADKGLARAYLKKSLAIPIQKESYPRLFTILIECQLDMDDRFYIEIIARITRKERHFLQFNDQYLLGMLFNNLAVAQKNLGQDEAAADNFQNSLDFFKRAGHLLYQGCAENNVAQTLRKMGQFEDAHSFSNDAIETFKLLEDSSRYAHALDTKANIYLDQRRYAEALEAIDDSLRILRDTGNHFLTLESMQTRMRIFLLQRAYESGFGQMSEAFNHAMKFIGESAAEEVLHEAALVVRNATPPYVYRFHQAETGPMLREGANLLIEDPTAPRYHAVAMKNEEFAALGLPEAGFTVIAEESIKDGDLIGVKIEETKLVKFGYLRLSENETLLDIPGSPPLDLKEINCRMLGKVIGRGELTEDGSLKVVAI